MVVRMAIEWTLVETPIWDRISVWSTGHHDLNERFSKFDKHQRRRQCSASFSWGGACLPLITNFVGVVLKLTKLQKSCKYILYKSLGSLEFNFDIFTQAENCSVKDGEHGPKCRKIQYRYRIWSLMGTGGENDSQGWDDMKVRNQVNIKFRPLWWS